MVRTNIRGEQLKDDDVELSDLASFAVVARTTGLVVDIYAGNARNDNVVTVKAAQTVTVTDATTSYVEIDSVGVATSNTTGFTSGRIPLATVVASGGNVTAVNDRRAWHMIAGSGGGAPTDAKYIVQQANGTLTAEQALGDLATGILKSANVSGILSIAVAGTDYYNPGGTDVAVADGGTGASTASGARTNLGAAASGANADITAISGLTGDIGKPTSLTGAAGFGLRTDVGAGNTILIQARDVDGASYTTFITLTANNTPTCDLSTNVTMGGNGIYYATGTDVAVADGGTGVSSLTAYAPLFGGTTSTGPVQSGTVGTAGQVLTSNGASALPTFQAASASAVNAQTFTASGTWTKPAGVTYVKVQCIGAGGGGGGGQTGTSGTARSGGGGGGGGNITERTFLAADLGATETVTVAAGGTAGAASGAGGAGGNSTFGGTVLLTGFGGAGGGAGAGGLAAGGQGAVTTTGGYSATAARKDYGANGGSGGDGPGNNIYGFGGKTSLYGGAGGGGGSGIRADNYIDSGAACESGGGVLTVVQTSGYTSGGGAGGLTSGVSGTAGAAGNSTKCGTGGGGGAAFVGTGTGGLGAAGGALGGGGGGGGAGTTGGTGGAGGRGEVRVYSW